MLARTLLVRAWVVVVMLAIGCGVRDRAQTPDPALDVDASAKAVAAEPASAPSTTMSRLQSAAGRDYHFAQATGGAGWIATNAAHQFTARFAAGGFSIAPTTPSSQATPWTWSMKLLGLHRGDATVATAEPTARAQANRLTYVREGGVSEWYVHGPRGLEQGFDVASRPAGDGDLVVELDTAGLAPQLTSDGKTIELRDGKGRAVLWYGELAVRDANGRTMPARLTIDGAHIALRVSDREARYPLVIDPLVWSEQKKLTPTEAGTLQLVGEAVGISGDTAVVGAYNDGNGAAYVFVRSGVTWTQQAKLTPSDAPMFNFGMSVAISGDTIVVGCQGRPPTTIPGAYVFVRTGTTWTQQQKLTSSDYETGDGFSVHVAIDGDTVLAGALAHAGGTGAGYVFVRSGTTWTQQKKLIGSDTVAGDGFGASVAISGNTAVLSSPYKATNAGAAYVFVRSGTSWTEQQKVTASDATNNSYFGFSVSLSNDTALLGAYGRSSNEGAAYVLTRSGTTWTEQQILSASDTPPSASFGWNVALHLDTAVVGTYLVEGAYVFARSGTTWTEQKKVTASDGAPDDEFGRAVSINGNTAVIGAAQQTTAAVGAAYVYVRVKTNGDSCSAATDCLSNYCVDGVCCDRACTGTCEACTAAKRGTGTNGVCGTIVDGSDPDVECPAMTCTAATQENGHTCNGAGACRVTTTTACAPFACDAAGKSCLASCTKDADCIGGDWCSGTSCVPKKNAGTKCGAGNECKSTFCADGVCCDKACSGRCEACVATKTGVPSSDGTCGFVPDTKDPDDDCPGTSCTAATFTEQVCDGAGACRGKTSSCAPYACDATGAICAKKCSVDGDCGTDGYCALTGECAPRKDKGATCGATNECKLTFTCVDGVCCDKACDGQCQACDVASSPGVCVTISGSPRGKRAVCAGDGTPCVGTCDGKSTTCTYPPATTTCAAKCIAGSSTKSTCSGAGACVAGTPTPCNAYTCDSATGACRTDCATDADCATGYGCSTDKKCTPKGGAKCSTDLTESVGSDGAHKPCAPFTCNVSTGNCNPFCVTTSDCAAGFACNESTKTCDALPGGDDGSSGGCALAPPSSEGGEGALLVVLAGAIVASRRRRAQRRPRGC